MHAPSVFGNILLQPQSIKSSFHRQAEDKIENLDEHRIPDAIGKHRRHAVPILDERGRKKHGEGYESLGVHHPKALETGAFAVAQWEKPAGDLGFWATASDTVK